MPPQRTMPPAKALKTERTHEENQERAYIAASRRSDRSLEARVESARRASEIHKRRTGRSLRVTEQDVVNEEMYEEEDDDLPLQYRRLTAHLQTGSADFNRRLSNYLTNHVAMRSALDQAITNAYAQQYPNAPQFAHNQGVYPSPFSPNSMPPQQSPKSFQPYPSPGTPAYRPAHQARSASVSHSNASQSPHMLPPSIQDASQNGLRRASGSSKSSSHSPPTANSIPQQVQRRASIAHYSPSATNARQGEQSQQMRPPIQPSFQPRQQQPQQQQQMPTTSVDNYMNISPFTTSLPTESQMLLGSALDPTDPATAMLMAGSENIPMPFDFTGSQDSKNRGFHQTFDGMSSTLAPSALDITPRHQQLGHHQPNVNIASSNPFMHLGLDGSTTDFPKGQQMYASGNSSSGSGAGTPGVDGGWDAFINEASWTENPT